MVLFSIQPLATFARLLFFASSLTMVSAHAKSDAEQGRADLETIKSRFVAALQNSLPSSFDPNSLLDTLQEDGSWPGIDYEDVSRTGFQHETHLQNMRALSQAYSHLDSAFYQDPKVRNAVLTALDFWIEHDFICENWWWNEMGTPDQLIDTLLLMDSELTDSQRREGGRIARRANLEAFGARPGGDLIKIAGTMGKRALFEKDVEEFEKAVAAMVGEVAITTGRGLQPDLSLQHRTDRVTSTLTYGYGYAAAFADYATKLQGTRFRFPDDAMELLIDFYLDGIHKSMAHGRYRDPHQLNRGITRRSPQRPTGPGVPQTLATVSDYRKDELEELVAVRQGQVEPAFTFNKYFWCSEYISHQRPKYFTSVRMYSTRNHSVESPYNEEGLRNHFLADGSNFITRTGEEYNHVFPVYDWRKIPGTTVVQKPSLHAPNAIPQRGLTDFVGGVSDGVYGAAVFDFNSPLDSLTARKAWFFFDDEYVSLGAGIASNDSDPVATTLNQAALTGDLSVRAGDRTFAPARGAHTLPETHWIWHDGIAYLFPSPAEVRVTNDTAQGNWRNINQQSWVRNEEIERDLFTLWLDHGTRPRDAAYAYIVVPGIEAEAVATYAEHSKIAILANSPAIQAVTHSDLGLSQLAFYEPGEIEVAPGLTVAVAEPALVMIQVSKGRIAQMTVADPARKHSSLHLRVSAPIEGSGENWTASWNADREQSAIVVDLPTRDYAGQSRVMVFPIAP